MVDISQSPLVSICCLTYNHEPFIRQCLDGVLMQKTDFPFEVLVYDDASSDGAVEVLREYEAKHPGVIKPIYQSENQYSLGKGFVGLKLMFESAQGNYIAYCEGDDCWTDPFKLQKQVDFLESNSSYVITYHNAKVIDENGNSIFRGVRKTDEVLKPSARVDLSSDELKEGEQTIATLTICFRNVFKTVGYPKEFCDVSNGDTALFSFLGNYGCGKYLGDIIDPALNRRHSGGVWSMKSRCEQQRMLATTFHQIMKYYRRIGNCEMTYYYREKEFNALKAFFCEAIASGERGELIKAYTRYCQICLRHVVGVVRLNGKIILWLFLRVRV